MKTDIPPRRQFRVGDCSIDPARRVVTNAGGAHRPRPKVFDVLLYLVENADRVVTKEELFGAVWAGAATTDDALVACIREIRKLLGDDARKPRMVVTAPRKGYILAAPVKILESAPPAGPEPSGRRGMPRRLIWVPAGLLLAIAVVAAWRVSGPGETPKLVGWWRFDESGGGKVADHSGTGNEGVVFHSLRRVPGPLAGSLEFDGLGYVQGTDAGKSFPLGDSPFTISAWLNCTHEPATGGTIFHFGTVGWRPPRSNMFLHLSPEGKATFGFAFGYQALVGARNLADGRWHHLAAFYTGGSARRAEVYADGEGEAAGVLTDPPNLGSGSPWTIGVSQGGSPPFEGRLADVRLYRGALTHPQIAALYRCGLADPDIVLPGGRKGYYLPLYRATITAEPSAANAPSVAFRYDGFGRGGVEFAASDGTCALENVRGSSIGSDLRISAELQVPAGTEAGPFFRARRVTPGDPIEAQGNGGYWVRLHADGAISLHSLDQPETEVNHPLVQSQPPARFDSRLFHSLDVEARGVNLTVRLDGSPVAFAKAAALPARGTEEGAAGIGFFVQGQPVESIQVRNAAVVR